MVGIIFFSFKVAGKNQYYPFVQDLLSAGANAAVLPEYFNFFPSDRSWDLFLVSAAEKRWKDRNVRRSNHFVL